jgi:hypothetical protein
VTPRDIAEAVGALVLAFVLVAWQVDRRRAYAAHLADLNAAAERDTTIHYLRDTLGVSRRQAQQLKVDLDQATHDKNERGAALVQLSVVLANIHLEREGTTVAVPDGLRLTSQVDTAGVHARADVQLTLIPAPARALWVWDVRRDPIGLTVDFSCRGDTALAHVVGPTWASIGITRAVQSPQFCNPPPRWNPLAFQLPSLPVAAVLILGGVLVGKAF